MCQRCGCVVTQNNKRKTSERFTCASCRMTPAKTIRYGNERCIPWSGDFDKLDRPMRNGQLFLEGERTCNHSDCVNGSHIK